MENESNLKGTHQFGNTTTKAWYRNERTKAAHHFNDRRETKTKGSGRRGYNIEVSERVEIVVIPAETGGDEIREGSQT